MCCSSGRTRLRDLIPTQYPAFQSLIHAGNTSSCFLELIPGGLSCRDPRFGARGRDSTRVFLMGIPNTSSPECWSCPRSFPSLDAPKIWISPVWILPKSGFPEPGFSQNLDFPSLDSPKIWIFLAWMLPKSGFPQSGLSPNLDFPSLVSLKIWISPAWILPKSGFLQPGFSPNRGHLDVQILGHFRFFGTFPCEAPLGFSGSSSSSSLDSSGNPEEPQIH